MSIEFGKCISVLAADLGLSQRKIAKQCGISHTTVHHLMNGERNASTRVALLLKNVLKPQHELEPEFLLLARYPSDEVKRALGRELTPVTEIKARKTYYRRRETGEIIYKLTL